MRQEELVEALRRLPAAARREILALFADEQAPGAAPRIFLSYSRDDSIFVRELMAGLERGGMRVWFDVRELAVGEDYLLATEKALRECAYCVVIVSRYSMSSPEVARELDIARAVGANILPVILQDARVADAVRNLHWIDFRFEFEAPLAALIGRLHGRPAASLTEQHLDSATKSLGGSGGFVPLFHRNMPPSVRWFGCALLAGTVGLWFAGIAFMGTLPVWSGVLAIYGILIMYQAFRVADRREPRGALRSSIWSMTASAPFLAALFSEVLESGPRHLVWGLAAFSTLGLVVASLIMELSSGFKRWLPARLERVQFLPNWLRWRKRAAQLPTAALS
jgi:hypothetical protein